MTQNWYIFDRSGSNVAEELYQSSVKKKLSSKVLVMNTSSGAKLGLNTD